MHEDTIKLLENRRSTRAFQDRKIEDETLSALKRLTLRAPSAGNMTMYSVIEVENQEKKDKLSVLCDNQPMIAKAPLVWVFLGDMERLYSAMKTNGSAAKCGNELRVPGIGDLHLALQDAIIAAQNSVIAAEALGLGSCFIGDVIEHYEELQALLELPSLAIPAAMVIFGYPKGEGRKKLTLRPESEYIFYKDKYRSLSKDEVDSMYANHTKELLDNHILPKGEINNFVDRFCMRKYLSEFMDEMNRSTAVFIKRWLEEER